MLRKYLQKLTLRKRMIVLNGVLVFVMALLLVSFVNLIAPFFISHDVGTPNTKTLVNTVDSQGNPITILRETSAPEGYTIFRDSKLAQGDPLIIVRILSLIGLICVVGVDFLAVRWVAKETLQPISQISQAAKQISARSLNQHLNYQGAQDEVKDLADAFDSMLERLEGSFKQQGQFISNLAHELRSPLTSMRMNVETLRSDHQATVADYQELTAALEKSLSRLERLIQDLLLLAKGDKEVINYPIVLAVLFEELLEDLSPFARERLVSIRLGEETDCEIRGDPVLLQRALYNLVENGILYNRPGGFVEILCHYEECQVVIEIRDNGVGITDKDKAHIFERFYRGIENPVIHNNGKGLGLAITAHIINLHQGRIEIESRQGLGSIFRVYLPQ